MATGKPTKEAYEKALESKRICQSCVKEEIKRRDDLLDQLLDSRETIKRYQEALKNADDVIQRYEIYCEIEKEGM